MMTRIIAFTDTISEVTEAKSFDMVVSKVTPDESEPKNTAEKPAEASITRKCAAWKGVC